MPDPVTPLTFDRVLSEELAAIDTRRRLVFDEDTENNGLSPQPEANGPKPPAAGADVGKKPPVDAGGAGEKPPATAADARQKPQTKAPGAGKKARGAHKHPHKKGAGADQKPQDEVAKNDPKPQASAAATGQNPPAESQALDGESGEYDRLKGVRTRALRSHLVGVAFSGGGIRSATFAVGILQGLATLRLLNRIDYLSTVSGGGWAGAWLAAWLKREGSVKNVEEELATSRVRQSQAERQFLPRKLVVDEEPEPINHLRSYSRFLAPRSGALTTDTWSLVTTYLRNVMINLSLLLSAALALVFLVRTGVGICRLLDGDSGGPEMTVFRCVALLGVATVIGVVLFWLAFAANARAVNYIRTIQAGGVATPALNASQFVTELVVPIVIAVFYLSSVALFCFRANWEHYRSVHSGTVVTRAAEAQLDGRDGPVLDWTWAAWWKQDIRTIIEEPISGYDRFIDTFVNGTEALWERHGYLVMTALGLIAVWVIYELARTLREQNYTPKGIALLVLALVPAAVILLWSGPGGGDGDYSNAGLRLLIVLSTAVVFGLIMTVIYLDAGLRYATARRGDLVLSAFLSGAAGGVLLSSAAILALRSGWLRGRADLVATFATPAGLLVIAAATVVHVAHLGRRIGELEREWWARLDACLLLAAVGWVAIFEVILYLPAAIVWISDDYVQTGVVWGLVSSWLGTTVIGVLAGSSARTGGASASPSLEVIAKIAPPVFLIGLFGLLGVLAFYLVDGPLPTAGPGHGMAAVIAYFAKINSSNILGLMACMIAFGMVAWFIANSFEVNLFSLNAMYANRLARCYLGASRRKARWPVRWGPGGSSRAGGGAPTNATDYEIPPTPAAHWWGWRWSRDRSQPDWNPNPNALRGEHTVTGFDLNDDIPLVDLQVGALTSGSVYPGPQLLINTSLNLVAGTELAWTDRKSESFILSPLHCGSKGTGYAVMGPGTRDHLSIARAIAISGAAVDPNMNFHQSPALTAFLTIFNARLGYWLENPMMLRRDSDETWKADSPKHGGLLISELIGGTGGSEKFVHLTDGGHFENTGVYELIRRRCRYIVACDANTDRTAADENLANLVRLVRIDFGIRIEIDASPLKVDDDRTCRAHVVIGGVRYDDVDSGQVPGILVYIRTSMTGDEPSDIRNYATVNTEFPYTSSANQYFDEAQFESYRALGDHVARVVFEDAKDDADRIPAPTGEDAAAWFRRNNRQLFAALRRRWAESMPDQDTRFLESSQGYSELQRDLQAGGPLRALSLEVYPELTDPVLDPNATAEQTTATRDAAEARRVELHTVARMLQVMENTWVGLDLKSHPEAPISHGWWSVFRRWTATRAFHRNWPILRPEFSTEFARFVESRLGLAPEEPEVISWTDTRVTADERKSLIAEFDREWPKNLAGDEFTSAMSLAKMIALAGDRVWAIVQKPKPSSDGSPAASDLRGIMLVLGASSLHPPKTKNAAGPGDPKRQEFEIVVWIRRSHRGIGLGTYALESKPATLLKFEEEMRGRAALFARYPKIEDDVVPSMWKRFFALYDFQTEVGAETEGNVPLILHRDL